MAPYSNRLFGGRLLTPAVALTLPANHPTVTAPVHGLGWSRPWHVVKQGAAFAHLRYRHSGDAHWPFAHSCTQTVTLSGGTARFEIVLRNNGPVAMPAGLGLHPRLALESSSKVGFNAERVWLQDQHGSPREAALTSMDSRFDFNLSRPAIGESLNHCFSGWSGHAEVLRPDLQLVTHMRASRNLGHLMVYRKPGEPWICLEPVSHATGAFSLEALHTADNGVRALAPKQTLRAWMEICVQAIPSTHSP